MRNVFEAILECGHDEDFSPAETPDFSRTDAPAGSKAKIDMLAERVLRGLPLWHTEDRTDYSGLTGGNRSANLSRTAVGDAVGRAEFDETLIQITLEDLGLRAIF